MNLIELAKISDLSLKKAGLNSKKMLSLAFRLTKTNPEQKDNIVKAIELSMVFDKQSKKYLGDKNVL